VPTQLLRARLLIQIAEQIHRIKGCLRIGDRIQQVRQKSNRTANRPFIKQKGLASQFLQPRISKLQISIFLDEV
jgi:hypothetical protein